MDVIDDNALPSIVYELRQVDFLKFDSLMSKTKQHEIAPILEKIGKYIEYGCFFGFNIDLTRSLQAQSNNGQTDIDTRFMWNYGMCKSLFA